MIGCLLCAPLILAGATVIPVERGAAREPAATSGIPEARIVHRGPDGDVALLPRAVGGEDLVFRIEPGRRAVPFGDAVAIVPLNSHEPGFPFDLRFVSAAGSRHVVRPGATVLDLASLQRYLVVSYRSPDSGAVAASDVFDERGNVTWTFPADGQVPPRVVLHRNLVAAIHPGRTGSRVDIVTRDGTGIALLRFDGTVLTGGSFASDGSGLLVWGPREAGWIDVGTREVAWRTRMVRGGRPLPSPGSLVTPVDGWIALPVRREIHGAGWAVELLMLRLGDGAVSEGILLHRSPSMPVSVRRVAGSGTERLVFPDESYDVVSDSGERP